MKKNIHPTWYHDCTVTCSCGNTFITGSTQKSIHVSICSKCHPFFTGESKFVDEAGRVDKFLQKIEKAKKLKTKVKKSKVKKQQKIKTYKQILQEQKQKQKSTQAQAPKDSDKSKQNSAQPKQDEKQEAKAS